MSEKKTKAELPTRAPLACETCVCPTCIHGKELIRDKKREERFSLYFLFLIVGYFLYFEGSTIVPEAISAVDWVLFDIVNPFKGLTTDYYVAEAVREDLCPQAEQLFPDANKDLWLNVSEEVASDSYRAQAIKWLSGAVQIPTESFDAMDPVGVDPRWEEFGPFHEYLADSFPLIHYYLNVTTVNTWGLVYEWSGSYPSLKPILLAAHQDVVPVDPTTEDEWTHPPFSGLYDGEFIWGRGSSDDKSGLIGTMAAIETLLKAGYEPERSIVLASGFDEEVSGVYGAQELAKYLEITYGKDAFSVIIDEGGGYSEQFGTTFAVPGIGEKGYIDTRIDVTSPGGHSSVPPDHTSIGMLAKLLVEFEENPMPVVVDRDTPIYKTMLCNAVHAKSMNERLRQVILRSRHSKVALWRIPGMIKGDKMLTSAISTTQAIDLIKGGVKNNALPEQAWAIVNHRIATQSNVDTVRQRDSELLKKLAESFKLEYNAFGQNLLSGSSGTLTLTDSLNHSLEPAPVSPTDEAPFKVLSGTIRASYETRPGVTDEKKREIKVAPGIMTGNTDTRYYWDLSKHIFRYNHHGTQLTGGNGVPSGVHTVNEHIRVDDFMEMIRFFVTFILNTNDYEL